MAASLSLAQQLAGWRWELARRLSHRPWVPALALLLLAGAVVLALDAWRQQAQRRYEHQHPVVQATHHRKLLSPEAQARRDLDALYQSLPAANALAAPTMSLLRLGEKHGLHLGQGEYHTVADADSRLLRYEVVLPVEGSPLVIEAFLSDAMKSLRPLTVRAVSFERENVLADQVKVRIHFVIFARSA